MRCDVCGKPIWLNRNGSFVCSETCRPRYTGNQEWRKMYVSCAKQSNLDMLDIMFEDFELKRRKARNLKLREIVEETSLLDHSFLAMSGCLGEVVVTSPYHNITFDDIEILAKNHLSWRRFEPGESYYTPGMTYTFIIYRRSVLE